ncbi:hypothetical protein [Pedobacter punctiformis]|uniref:Uncharacterized protein n=1 Tax=Pedobacter punctiformis TaxID=3004097 RepID=A0ABT4LCK7_9SPHI|nr:hypothetical protein [Pedobacter sp. HCMS5-2]MCZ4245655.1 hypothetical protein [Pedobacter sp. HCMS5-2]
MHYLKKTLFLLCFCIGICHAQQSNPSHNYSLSGFINKKIPVELNITVSKNIILGNIRYLNSKAKTPIKIIGELNAENQYVLHEFEKDGNISGNIYAALKDGKLQGDWSSTKTDTSYTILLNSKANKNVKPEVILPISPNSLAGKYSYQYGENGYQGSIIIKKLSGNTYSYDIGSVTHAPGRNIADASGKAVLKNNQFLIEINKSCRFIVKFYNDFLTITEGRPDQLNDCQFGHNATLEGTYLKIK